MTPIPERRTAVAALLRDRGALRMPVRGRSMLPTLREPMVLEIGPAANARVGDIVAFALGDAVVAHRIVARDAGAYLTAGDAQPGRVERIVTDHVLGRVVAVWSDASAAAVRVDGVTSRLRGWCYGRFHPIRYGWARARERVAGLARSAQPRRRARTTLQLIDALGGAETNDTARLACALNSGAHLLVATATRHGCGAMLGEVARRTGVAARLDAGVAASLRRARLDALLATSRMHRAVCATIEVLHEAGVPFALLKGAARVYSAAPDAAYQTSDDIDVLVRRADRDAVSAAFVRRGYTGGGDARAERRYRAHHHAVPLFPPGGEFPIEIHHELARPGTLSTRTDWAALAPYLMPCAGAGGAVAQLNALGTALHLAIHAIGLQRLRDVALLARVVRALDPAALAVLRAVIRDERCDAVRLEASVALAARIADIPWTAGPEVERYVRWALLREDLPALLRARCSAVEQYFAHPGSPFAWCSGLVPWWSHGLDALFAPARVAGLCAANAATLVYAALMPREEPA